MNSYTKSLHQLLWSQLAGVFGLFIWAWAATLGLQAQTTILSEGFEGDFPGAWSVGDANSSGTPAYWDDVRDDFGGEGARSGSWKGYCAGVGYAGNSANPSYLNSMSAYMSRNINLSGYSSATLTFWYKIPSIESGNYDKLRVYIGSSVIWEGSTPQTSWTQVSLNLNAYLGATRTLKFEFYSDDSGTAEGAYLDDIVVAGNPILPRITVVKPGAGERVVAGQSYTIEWQAENIPAPIWKFALNKSTVHQYPIFPSNIRQVSAGVWRADWAVPAGQAAGCDYDLWVKDDSTGVDDHSELFCIQAGPSRGIRWQQVNTGVAPGARSDFGLAWDGARNEAVLFGGGIHGAVWQQLGDTWVWREGGWRQLSPGRAPAPRRTHGMAYDTVRQRVVLYGGTLDAFGGSGSNETWEWDGVNWTLRSGVGAPTVQHHVRLVYDEARRRVVLFGGYQLDETWTYDGNRWTREQPAQSPPPLIYHALAYDRARQRVVLFGGGGGGGMSNETWEWDGRNWERKSPAVRPAARGLHTLVYSEAFGGCVLFGGYPAEGQYLNDAWVWDGTEWRQLSGEVRPPERVAHGMVANPGGQLLLFGGGGPAISFFSDTWIGEPDWLPPARITVVKPGARERVVAGQSYTIEWQAENIPAPIWKFALNKGTVHQYPIFPSNIRQVSPGVWRADWAVPAGQAAGCDYDLWVKDDSTGVDDHSELFCIGNNPPRLFIRHLPNQGVEIVVNGSPGASYRIEVAHNFKETRWVELGLVTLDPAGQGHLLDTDAPEVKWRFYRARLALDGARPGINILKPGFMEKLVPGRTYRIEWRAGNISNPNWKFALNKSTVHQYPIFPSNIRQVSAGVWRADWAVPAGQAAGCDYDLWVKDDSTGVDDHSELFCIQAGPSRGIRWQQVNTGVAPGARSDFGLAWDGARNEAVLFGGGIHGAVWQQLGDTWVWREGGWRQLSPGRSPAPRRTHGMAYDTVRQRVVLYGGTLDAYGFTESDETWEWDGANWTVRSGVGAPTARQNVVLAYDEARRKVVLFGGLHSLLRELNETWTYDGSRWTREQPAQSPPPLVYHALAYDRARQRVVLFGGGGGGGMSNETWEWDGRNWERKSPAVRPAARGLHTLVYSEAFGGCVLFGGYPAEGQYLNDAWVWDGTEWRQSISDLHPPERVAHSMIASYTDGTIILYGGYRITGGPDRSDFFNDTWIATAMH